MENTSPSANWSNCGLGCEITKRSIEYANTWAGDPASTYDNGSAFVACDPVFHWAGGTDHVLSSGVTDFDILGFWTKGGNDPTIYSTISGQDFLT